MTGPQALSATGVHRPRQRAEAPATEEFLRLLSSSADGVFAVDGKQRIVSWSEAAADLLNCPAGQALGRYCYEVVLGRDYEGHPFCRRNCPTMRAARRGCGVPNYDIACRRNGDNVWLNVSIVPVPHARPGAAVAIHLIRDVSKRRRSERLAQAAIETVSEFMAESPGFEAEPGPYPAPEPRLTDREIEVLRLLADGLGTQALTKKLGLSTATVRNHIQRLLAKVGAHNRLEAVVYGARHRLI
jgi:PAS domain S-box-containing protein